MPRRDDGTFFRKELTDTGIDLYDAPHRAIVGAGPWVGAVVTALVALAFWLDRRSRMFSFFGNAFASEPRS